MSINLILRQDLSRYVPRRCGPSVADAVHLAGLAAVHGLDVGARCLGGGDRLVPREVLAVRVPGFLEHGGADGVDPLPSRQFYGGRADERVERAVDDAGDGSGDDRVVGQNAADEREAAAVRDVIDALADEFDLPEQLVGEPGEVVLAGE